MRSNTTFERHKHKTTSQYALLRLKQWDTQVCVCVSVCEASITQTCCLKVYKVCKCPWDMLSKFNTPLYTLTTMPTFNTWTASAKCSGSAGLFWGFAPTWAHTHTHTHTSVHTQCLMEKLTRDSVAWHSAYQHSISFLPLYPEVSFPSPDKHKGSILPAQWICLYK